MVVHGLPGLELAGDEVGGQAASRKWDQRVDKQRQTLAVIPRPRVLRSQRTTCRQGSVRFLLDTPRAHSWEEKVVLLK